MAVLAVVVCLHAAAGCAPRRPSDQVQKKLVVLGFDGLDPTLVSRWMDEGKLPNMRKVADEGAMRRLETAASAESAAAWASFATGMNGGKNDVFGSVVRDASTYQADGALMHMQPPQFLLRMLPIAGPTPVGRRAGTSFWVHAGRAGVRSSVLAVPVTFPAEEVPNGELLAGPPAPDLRGTDGSFAYFGTDLTPAEEGSTESGGLLRRLVFDGQTARSELIGPPDPLDGGADALRLPFAIHWNRPDHAATIEIGDDSLLLRQGEWSKWIDLDFRVNVFTALHGMAQMYLASADDQLRLYVTPIHWKPDAPPAPLSSPASLSADLFERLGYYRTLGWAEATAALNENRIDEQAFMDDLFRAFDDRAQVILQRIDTRQWNLLVGVVGSTDRVQHMMWRMFDPAHPMHDKTLALKYADAIERVYRRADDFVGEVVSRLEPGTPILIVSTYGFHAFRQAVNLNTWLVQEGFMTLKGDGPEGAAAIDWPRTRAYAAGFGQIYLNLRGREGQGTVDPPAAGLVADDLSARLLSLTDPATGQRMVNAVYKAADTYTGPFASGAADLQVGFADGYRVSTPTIAGAAPSEAIVVPNMRKWSGDHGGYDYRQTPGVLISSVPVVGDAARVVDIAPTVLRYFGVEIPAEIDGQPLF